MDEEHKPPPVAKLPPGGPMDFWAGHRLGVRIYNMGITRRHVAARMGVQEVQLRRYISAANRMSTQRLYDMSIILQVHPGWFFEGSPDLPLYEMADVRPPEQSEVLSPQGFEVLQMFHALSRGDRRHLVGVLKAMTGAREGGEKADG